MQKPSPIPELIHRLNEAMFGDVARLRRRLHAIEIARRDRRLDHIPKLESDFRRELFTSIDRRDHRAKTVLQSKFDQDLPISPEKLDNQSSRSVVKIPACDNTTETEPPKPRYHVRSTMKLNLTEAFSRFSDHWSPRIAAELNGQHVKLAKFKGAFEWHHHEHEDEMFLVHRGSFVMEFRDKQVVVNAGEFLVVPRGVEHRPVAAEEVEVILFEPATTLNTGNVVSERTVRNLKSI